MKKYIVFVFVFLFFLHVSPLSAQETPRHGRKDNPPVKVEEMVSDLSVKQKRSLLQIQEKSHERIAQLNNQLKEVRDSIRTVMRQDGDNSKTLYPLFDREGALQAQISKEMYTMRTQIDAILTPQQLAELRKALEARRKGRRR